MKKLELKCALAAAIRAAHAAGKLMRQNLHSAKTVNLATSHDIKLELDVRCQKLIERTLRAAFPNIALLGEEGDSGDVNAPCRWVVDPIDGTVNYAYGIPHAAVSIALEVCSPESRVQSPKSSSKRRSPLLDATRNPQYVSVVGVIYDPFLDELWTAIRGEPARCNGQIIRVSKRTKPSEAIVTIGFAKSKANLRKSLPYFKRLAYRVRKVRIMGSAALALTYVAMGRFDAYVERGISLWDIAAGGLIVECAGGEFWVEPVAGYRKYRMIASNGRLKPSLKKPQ